MKKLVILTLAAICLIASACSKTLSIESITFINPVTTIAAGRVAKLNYTIAPASSQSLKLNWKSSDESVATVTDSYVFAKAPGTCTITASYGEVSAYTMITVESKRVTRARFSPTSLVMNPGGTAEFEVLDLEPEDATLYDIRYDINPEDQEFFTIVGISDTKVTVLCDANCPNGKKATVYCSGYGDNALGSISLSCVDLPVQSVTVSPSTSIKYVGDEMVLKAIVSPSNTTHEVDLAWTSSDPSVATVTGNGDEAKVTAVAEGNATITVTERNSSLKGSCTLTVKAVRDYASLTPGFYSNVIANADNTFSVIGFNNFSTKLLPGGLSLYLHLGYSDGYSISSTDHAEKEFTVTSSGDIDHADFSEGYLGYQVVVGIKKDGGSGTVTVNHPSWKSSLSKTFTAGFGSVTMEKPGNDSWSGYKRNSTTVKIGGDFTVTRSSSTQILAFCVNAGDYVEWSPDSTYEGLTMSSPYSCCGWLKGVRENSGTLKIDTGKVEIRNSTPAGTYTFSLDQCPGVTWTLTVK